jgi:hypothetical protein
VSNPHHKAVVAAMQKRYDDLLREHNRLLLSTGGGFEEWWETRGYGVEHFKPCRAAWNAALLAQKRRTG